ncbi:DNA-directed RNA polymerase sigma-70 factor [Bacteroidia bacterium]|nr:DNA-directed RNA polymerase sigma-70 factor [Bacteroidia bacterium]
MQIERFKSEVIPLRDTLFRTAVKYLQQPEDAEDVVQEVLLRLWNRREQLDTVVNPAAFAMQMTKNSCLDRLKLQKETTEADDLQLGTTRETPHSTLEQHDAVALVKQIIEHLPELQRQIIRMRDVEGYELQEIADITATQITAVTVNLSRARKKVRETYLKIMNYENK